MARGTWKRCERSREQILRAVDFLRKLPVLKTDNFAPLSEAADCVSMHRVLSWEMSAQSSELQRLRRATAWK